MDTIFALFLGPSRSCIYTERLDYKGPHIYIPNAYVSEYGCGQYYVGELSILAEFVLTIARVEKPEWIGNDEAVTLEKPEEIEKLFLDEHFKFRQTTICGICSNRKDDMENEDLKKLKELEQQEKQIEHEMVLILHRNFPRGMDVIFRRNANQVTYSRGKVICPTIYYGEPHVQVKHTTTKHKKVTHTHYTNVFPAGRKEKT